MPRESVDQCSRFVTACGVNDQSRPFVDDDQFVILEKNIQRHFFRRNFAAGRWRKSCDHHIASTQLRAGFGNASIDKHRIFFNQFLERSATEKRHAVNEIAIQALFKIVTESESDLDGMIIVRCRRFFIECEERFAIHSSRSGQKILRIIFSNISANIGGNLAGNLAGDFARNFTRKIARSVAGTVGEQFKSSQSYGAGAGAGAGTGTTAGAGSAGVTSVGAGAFTG